MMLKYVIALAVLIVLTAAFTWAFLPARHLPGNRARHLRVRLHLRLHPGKGFAHLFTLHLRWSRFAALLRSGRIRAMVPLWYRIAEPRQHSVFLGRAHYRHRLHVPLEEHLLVMAPPRTYKTAFLADVILRYPGPVIATTTKADVYQLTAAVRAEQGRVHVFNPQHIGGVASTFCWDPVAGCEDPATAIRRADAFAFAVSQKGVEDGTFWSAKASDYLRGYFHAAALARYDLRAVAAWVAGADPDVPERILIAAGADQWAWTLAELRSEAHDRRDRADGHVPRPGVHGRLLSGSVTSGVRYRARDDTQICPVPCRSGSPIPAAGSRWPRSCTVRPAAERWVRVPARRPGWARATRPAPGGLADRWTAIAELLSPRGCRRAAVPPSGSAAAAPRLWSDSTVPVIAGRLGPSGHRLEGPSGWTTATAPWTGRPGAGAGPAGLLTCCCRPGWPRAAPTAPRRPTGPPPPRPCPEPEARGTSAALAFAGRGCAGWLRRLRSRAGDRRLDATAALGVITAGRDWPCLAPCGSPLGDALAAVIACGRPGWPAWLAEEDLDAGLFWRPPPPYDPAATRQLTARARPGIPSPRPGQRRRDSRFPRREHRHPERHDDTPRTPPAKCPQCARPALGCSDATTLILSVRHTSPAPPASTPRPSASSSAATPPPSASTCATPSPASTTPGGTNAPQPAPAPSAAPPPPPASAP